MRARRDAVPASSSHARGSRPISGALASQRSSASKLCVGASAPGAESASPRSSAASSTPCRFTAQRAPGASEARLAPKLWSPRTRARPPLGNSSTASPAASGAPVSVPVTTGPKPRISKQRSTQSRGGPLRGVRARARCAARASAARSSAIPAPLAAETRTDSASASEVPASSVAHLGLGELRHVRRHQVALRERHDARLHPQQVEDRDVLARLGHRAFVGGHHQEHEIDAGRAGHHRAHESLVPGHVHHAEREPGA